MSEGGWLGADDDGAGGQTNYTRLHWSFEHRRREAHNDDDDDNDEIKWAKTEVAWSMCLYISTEYYFNNNGSSNNDDGNE